MISITLIESTNFYLGLGTIGLIAVIGILVFDMRVKRELEMLIMRYGMLIAFLTAVGASIITLIYSEIFGFIPCGLCWLERIMLYPQVILLGMAIFYKDYLMPRYGVVLSLLGLIISLYHHYLQMGGSEFVKCPAAGANCAERSFFEFGFVTFPFMAAVLFAFLIALYMYILNVYKKKSI